MTRLKIGRNVLTMLAMVVVAAGLNLGAAVAPQDAPKQEQPAQEGGQAKEESTQESAEPTTPERKSADEVLEGILKKRPQKRLVPPVGSGEPDNSAAAWPEGWQVVSRAGRLIPDGDQWLFVFESDSTENPEPRLRLLPNLKLEAMVRETTAAGTSPVYIVSGEVTVFFGENYLLTRLALRKPTSTNLSK